MARRTVAYPLAPKGSRLPLTKASKLPLETLFGAIAMTDKGETRRYLVILSLKTTEPARLQALVPSLKEVLSSVSREPIEQVFRSVTADVFGFFIRSRLAAGQIVAAIESPGKAWWQKDNGRIPDVEPFLQTGDALMVVEIGEDFVAGFGFTRAGNWLQHH